MSALHFTTPSDVIRIAISSRPGHRPTGRRLKCTLLLWAALFSSASGIDARLSASERGGVDSRRTLFQWDGDAETEEAFGRPPLASDRPDFTEASSTVGIGVVQFEMGYTFSTDGDGATRQHSHTYPEMLMRAGVLAEWLELRVGWTMLSEQETSGGVSTSATGPDDLYLGLKLALTEQVDWWPETAIVPQMTLPTASSDIVATFIPPGGLAPVSVREYLPGCNLLYGWDVTDLFSMAGSSQVNRAIAPTGGDLYWEFAQSWTVGASLTEQVGGYVEWFVLVPDGSIPLANEHYLNGGLTYLVTDDLQLDLRSGVGLNRDAVDFFAGAGLVVRL